MQREKEGSLELKAYVSRLNLTDEKGKPRLLAILFCDFINQTKDSKPNLIGVFDRIYVDPNLKTTPHIGLFVRVAEALEGPLTLIIFDADSQPVLVTSFDADLAKLAEAAKDRPPQYPRQIQGIVGVQFVVQTEGVYWFDISYQGKSLGGAGLPIEYRKEGVGNSGTDTFI